MFQPMAGHKFQPMASLMFQNQKSLTHLLSDKVTYWSVLDSFLEKIKEYLASKLENW